MICCQTNYTDGWKTLIIMNQSYFLNFKNLPISRRIATVTSMMLATVTMASTLMEIKHYTHNVGCW